MLVLLAACLVDRCLQSLHGVLHMSLQHASTQSPAGFSKQALPEKASGLFLSMVDANWLSAAYIAHHVMHALPHPALLLHLYESVHGCRPEGHLRLAVSLRRWGLARLRKCIPGDWSVGGSGEGSA